MGEVMAMQLGVSICAILYEYSGKHIALNMFIADVGGELKQILLCLWFCCKILVLWKLCRILQKFQISASWSYALSLL